MLKLDPGDFAGTQRFSSFTPYEKRYPSYNFCRGNFHQIWRFDPHAKRTCLGVRGWNHVHGRLHVSKMASTHQKWLNPLAEFSTFACQFLAKISKVWKSPHFVNKNALDNSTKTCVLGGIFSLFSARKEVSSSYTFGWNIRFPLLDSTQSNLWRRFGRVPYEFYFQWN